MHGGHVKWTEFQAEGDDSFLVRANHHLCGHRRQENAIHESCLYIQSSYSGILLEILKDGNGISGVFLPLVG